MFCYLSNEKLSHLVVTYFPYLCNKNGKIIEWIELIRN